MGIYKSLLSSLDSRHALQICLSGYPDSIGRKVYAGGKEDGLWLARRASADLSIFPNLWLARD
jgi:hypothetical protein